MGTITEHKRTRCPPKHGDHDRGGALSGTPDGHINESGDSLSFASGHAKYGCRRQGRADSADTARSTTSFSRLSCPRRGHALARGAPVRAAAAPEGDQSPTGVGTLARAPDLQSPWLPPPLPAVGGKLRQRLLQPLPRLTQ